MAWKCYMLFWLNNKFCKIWSFLQCKQKLDPEHSIVSNQVLFWLSFFCREPYFVLIMVVVFIFTCFATCFFPLCCTFYLSKIFNANSMQCYCIKMYFICLICLSTFYIIPSNEILFGANVVICLFYVVFLICLNNFFAFNVVFSKYVWC